MKSGGGGVVSEDTADTTIAANEEVPPPVTPVDETASHPGPGTSMPSGTVAPPPLVPVNFTYTAEGSYCRFENDPAQLMVWGKIYRLQGDGQFDSTPTECTEHCKRKELRLSFVHDGEHVLQFFPLESPPEFHFTAAIDDPKSFGLSLIYQKTVAIIGQEPNPPGQGALINVTALQPYQVDGAPAFCPTNPLMKGKFTNPSLQIGPIAPAVER